MSVLIGLLGAYEQWGFADNGAAAQNWSKTITLPIAFSNPNYIVAGSATIIDGIYVLFTHSNKTTSSVLIFASGCWSGNTSRYANWFALGYQQWGVVNSYRVTVTFPLAYTKLYCLNAYMTASSTSTIDLYSRNVTLKTFDIVASVPDDEFASFDMAFWLSLGI